MKSKENGTTPAKTTLNEEALATALAELIPAYEAYESLYPGPSGERQAAHTVYGGAQLFRAGTAQRLGKIALGTLTAYAPGPLSFARALGLPGAETLPDSLAEAEALEAAVAADPAAAQALNPSAALAHTLYHRVVDKLRREAVEDFRIDFEDGFGNRPDPEEDAAAVDTARETALGMEEGSLPPFVGIRIKSLSAELRERSLRTLDLYLTTLVGATGGSLPEGFVVTLPKVVLPEQVTALVKVFEALEAGLPLAGGSLKLELMVETTQSLFDGGGRAMLPQLVDAARGRCVGAHFGVYDYTAGVDLAAGEQKIDHFSCDVARNLMQITLGGMGIALSDGATNIMPVAPHRAKDGDSLTPEQVAENRRGIHAGWRLHYQHVRHSLSQGYYQGWDLHPAQLPTRYAALYAFFLEGLPAATQRLRSFVEKAAQATLAGDVFDDAATGQGLLNFFLRGMACGAVTEDEALATGLSLEELRSRSFVKILEGRR